MHFYSYSSYNSNDNFVITKGRERAYIPLYNLLKLEQETLSKTEEI